MPIVFAYGICSGVVDVMNAQTLIVPLIAFLCWFQVSGQQIQQNSAPVLKDRDFDEVTDDDFYVGSVKGDVKTKAVFLPKPDYQSEVRQAGAEGVVRIRISLDLGGAVESTQILSGDPLLHEVSESAAKRSKFRIARDAGGHAVKIDGVLVYSFEIRKSDWTKVAHGLTILDRFPVTTFPIPSTRKALQPEWIIEREMLETLEAIRRKFPRGVHSERPKLVKFPEQGGDKETSTIAHLLLPSLPQISADQISVSRNLIHAIRERLKDDALAAWKFEVGLKLDDAMMSNRDPRDLSTSRGIVKSLIDSAPTDVNPANLAALRSLETAFTKDRNSSDTLDEVRRAFLLVLHIK